MKKKNLIKIFVLLLIFSLVIAFPGCKSNDSGAANGENTESELEKEDYKTQDLSQFVTKDINGEEVTQEIFSDYDLTFVNVWGTFCGPCIEEMPYLAELHKEYKDKGINVLGIVVDVQNEDLSIIEEQIDLAKEIVDKYSSEYTHLTVSNDILSIVGGINAIPASFFVDDEGKIVSELYVGSKSKEDWKAVFDKMLEEKQ